MKPPLSSSDARYMVAPYMDILRRSHMGSSDIWKSIFRLDDDMFITDVENIGRIVTGDAHTLKKNGQTFTYTLNDVLTALPEQTWRDLLSYNLMVPALQDVKRIWIERAIDLGIADQFSDVEKTSILAEALGNIPDAFVSLPMFMYWPGWWEKHQHVIRHVMTSWDDYNRAVERLKTVVAPTGRSWSSDLVGFFIAQKSLQLHWMDNALIRLW